MTRIAIPKETFKNESRVSATPETVKKFIDLGCEVVVEKGAGEGSSFKDDTYSEAGATIESTFAATVKDADIVLTVRAIEKDALKALPSGAIMIGQLNPYDNRELLNHYSQHNLSTLAMELLPRITRAQSMDVLSSQANLAGYRAVIEAAEVYGRAFPMMMTAAGTVPAARIFVMGAGVAGLQAIATARRMGAQVTATDVRPAAKEQVQSLGAKFIAVEDEEFKEAETAGGYAKSMSESYQKKQAELVADHITKQNIVITTALIPGKPAPRLITKDMIKTMPEGSVLVDLAVERGGNIGGAKAGEITHVHGSKIIGYTNLPSRIAATSSVLYAKNLYNFVSALWNKDKGFDGLPLDDELVKAMLLTHAGKIVHPGFKEDDEADKPASRSASDSNDADEEYAS
jgi:NAD(P) transhydrogenase subunit alpha